MKQRLIVITSVFLVAAACASARPAADACKLLSKRDVARVQGEAFANTSLTTRGATSQCFYQLPTFINSISVDVIRDGRTFWKENFEKERPAPRVNEEGVEIGKKKIPPMSIAGIGEKAFWAGSSRTGSLYVLYRDAVLRISVGGKGTEEEKIARSKQLAMRALKRL
jgi:hypothetical protein